MTTNYSYNYGTHDSITTLFLHIIPRSSQSQCAQIKRNCCYCFLEHGFVWKSSESHVPRILRILLYHELWYMGNEYLIVWLRVQYGINSTSNQQWQGY